MSISPAVRSATRAAYRDVLRAATLTFPAFRTKVRSDLSQTLVVDEAAVQQQGQFLREIAGVLRRNVVQATKVDAAEDGSELYRIRLTKDTELGDNESIKNPPPVESSRSQRRRAGQAHNSSTDAVQPNDETSLPPPIPAPPRFFSALKKAHKERILPEIREDDIEESFVRGSGPGGQSINKTENNVQLLHKPTGVRVSCQETRSLSQNRKLARKWLLEKACYLDQLANPGLSKEDMKAAKQRERERRRRKKAKKKAKLKEAPQSIEEEYSTKIHGYPV
ncbi:hypothetical protein NLJ89_g5580 [Agrocybe chaxingu]|uniref:Prokaryotic-type class I peptide chain release factors domain-containing protein n=1 Tax=Agrocybe chaxingu TaxID=84603 RepID=A0A9W8K0R2_9AGAR|nr:hypothetical protein NLJ89_g5580 [Agrocybe chaxingu]